MKEIDSYSAIEEVFTEILIKNNYRKTQERYAILKQIYSTDEHLTAEQIFKVLQNEYRVSLATVYNTLELLVERGLIIIHKFGSQPAEYEKAFGIHEHYHLICTNCGRIKEFSDKKIRLAIEVKDFASFKPSYHTLYIYGLCKNCMKLKKIKN